MFSVAFLFQRSPGPPLQDRFGLAPAAAAVPPTFDEKKYALKLVEGVAKIRDVEHMLEQDPALKRSMIDSSAALLEAAGYDRSAYYDFVGVPPTQ